MLIFTESAVKRYKPGVKALGFIFYVITINAMFFRFKIMDYSSKSYNDRLREQRDFNRQGCLQFILFFLLMAICIAFIIWTQSGVEY